MNKMPIGIYCPGDSLLHRLDARAKLSAFLLLATASVLTQSAWGYALLLAFSAFAAIVSHLSLQMILGGISRLWLFFLTIFLMNSFFFAGTDTFWSWGIFNLSLTGIYQGCRVILSLVAIMMAANIFLATTAPMELTEAIKALLKPGKLLRLPVNNIAMTISVAMQFIPTLSEEAALIKQAQTARGAPFESKRVWERILSFKSILIPIFVNAIRRADELSLAMEARGYGNGNEETTEKRTRLHSLDYGALLLSVLLCIAQLAL